MAIGSAYGKELRVPIDAFPGPGCGSTRRAREREPGTNGKLAMRSAGNVHTVANLRRKEAEEAQTLICRDVGEEIGSDSRDCVICRRTERLKMRLEYGEEQRQLLPGMDIGKQIGGDDC